jgi:hypothetical protein
MTTGDVVKHAVLTGCVVLGLSAMTTGTALGGLTARVDQPAGTVQGTYTNAKATVHFRSRRTDARVVATVRGADGAVLMAVKGDRERMPRVTYAGIRVTNHGEFSEDERSAIRALRVSPQALAFGEMLRAQERPDSPPSEGWAALHELYRFLTFIGGPGPDGLYEWEEIPEAMVAADRDGLYRPALARIDDGGGDPGGGGGGGGGGGTGGTGGGSGGGPSGSPWDCAGDADQCVGQIGSTCWGAFVFGTRIHKWTCEALRHDINARQRDCNANGSSTTGGCCGTLEDAIASILTQPDLGRAGLASCTLNANCPTPSACCALGPLGPNGCPSQGGVCREIQFCNPNNQPGSTRLWPCPNEATAAAKYLVVRGTPDYQNGNLLASDGVLITLAEPGRVVMGISCRIGLIGLLRVGDDSALCQRYGKCSVRDIGTLDQAIIQQIQSTDPADLPFVHQCIAHGFGWYETPNVPAGSWLAFAGTRDSWHATADVFAYVGNGGMYQATWWGNACRLNVNIDNPRFLVRQQYRDFFGREPDGATPFGGARDYGGGDWQMLIDSLAVRSSAELTWVEFMQSDEFVAAHPVLHPANIGTPAFNQEFVLQCYRVFLRREPDPDGFAFWLNHINTNGNYIGIVGGFLGSGEYRGRAACGFAPFPCF